MKSLIQWLVIPVIVFIAWSWLSGTILFLYLTHHAKPVSPFLYISTCLHWDVAKHIIHVLFVSGLSSALILSLVVIILSKRSIPDIYGKARFANYIDIKKAGLLSGKGIVLGKSFFKYLMLDGYEHITLFAPTGTGKTIGLTVPNLLSWEDSCVASDIKLQLFKLTSGYRRSIGHAVYLWNPASPDGITHCYNPLDVIGDNPYTRIDEIQKIAAIFIPDNPKVEPIWIVQSRYLFVALTLYVLDTSNIPKNLPEVINVFKTQPKFIDFIQEVLETRHDLDLVCRNNFLKFSEIHEKTRVSVLTSFASYFELFDNPLVAAATSRSDFNIKNLRRKKMTIYVGVTNDNLVRLSPLLTVFYQQVTDVLTRKVPEQDEPYGVLFLMDEFSALRRMESFHKNIGLYREYMLRMVIIIQELSQLYDIYGRDGAKVFINAKVRIAYTQNDDETCKLIETALGTKTISIKQQSRSLSAGLLSDRAQKTESTHYAPRPLMLAQEIRLLPENKEIILLQGHLPIYAEKIAWFKQEPFKNRMMGAIQIESILPEVKRIMEQRIQCLNIKTSEAELKESSNQDEPLDQVI